MYTIGMFAKRVGVAVHTVQRWDREGRLKARRTLSNRRYYTEEDVVAVLGPLGHHGDDMVQNQRRCVAYCRVSSPAQKPDLRHQRQALEHFCRSRGLLVDDWIEEIGGRLNVQRKQFLRVVDGIIAGDIGALVIAHTDRLARFGFDLIVHECVVHDCELLILNTENTESLSPEQELVQDLMTIMHCFSSRLYGLRSYRKTLKQALAANPTNPTNPTTESAWEA